MNISVSKNQVIINPNYILNDKEYNINTCYFTFTDEYSEDLVKKAIFVQGTQKIEMSIINNECQIPNEVLNMGVFELHVYAYEVHNEELVLRYSPSYAIATVRSGSYVSNTTNTEEITPTQFQQYMQAMNDGLNEVENVNINASKLGKVATITITDRNGIEKSVEVLDGAKGETGDTGATGQTGATGADGFSPIANVSKNGSIATISITDKNGTTTTNISDGVDGKDGAIQYTAGDNIKIENNVISTAKKIWIGTQEEYDNLQTYDNDTLYFIKETS